MSTNATVVICMLIGFIILNIVAIKIYTKPQKDMETYAVGNRKMPWFMVCFTYMGGWYVGSTYTGWVGNSIDLGFFAQYLCIYALGSLVFLQIMARTTWSWGKFYGLETPSEFMGLRFRSISFQRFYSVFMLVVDGSWLVIEITTLAYIINIASNGVISMPIGIIVGGLVVGIYTAIGGVGATAITSAVQGFFFVVIGTIMFIILTNKTYGGFVSLFEMLEAHKPELMYLPDAGGVKVTFITATITGVLGGMCWPTGFQRLYLASSPRETKKSLYVAPICALIVAFFILAPALGISLMDDAPADSQIGLFWLANKVMGPVALGFVAIFAGAAAMSTISAVANCISIPFAKDILALIWKDTSIVKLSKWTTMGVTIVSILIALGDIPQLNFFAIMFYGFVCQCIVPMLGGTFWKRGNKQGAWAGMIVGCLMVTVDTFTGCFGGVGSLYGIAVNAIVFLICGGIFGKQDHVDELFEVIKLYDNDGNFFPEINPSLAEKCTHDPY